MLDPQSRFYESHGLRLHYADWGNAGAPPLILVHGGRDHCRSWDAIARSLHPHFHVIAPDLRGHGDSDWTKGGSYALTEYVYDLVQLVRSIAAPRVTLIGHSMGGMVSLIFSGSFPELVDKLVVLDGVTMLPDSPKPPTHERIGKWVSQLDRLHDRTARRYPTLEDAAAQMVLHNKRLSRDLALHLATHGARQNEDGTYSWKFDPYVRIWPPYDMTRDEIASLWSSIACPTLLVWGKESWARDPAEDGRLDYFQDAGVLAVDGAGHWLQHDKPDELLGEIRKFLGLESID